MKNLLKKFIQGIGIGAAVAILGLASVAFADRTWTPPDQTGQAGKFLQTDGVNTLWAAAGGGGGSPCTTASGAFQYNNAGTFGCDIEAFRNATTHDTTIGDSFAVLNFPVFTGGGLNDLRVGGAFTGVAGTVYTITINVGGAVPTNTFNWSASTGGGATNVAMTGSSQTLNNGVVIQFSSIHGHTSTNFWTITAIPITTGFVTGNLLGGQGNGIGTFYQDATNNLIGINLFGSFNGGPIGAIEGLVSLGGSVQSSNSYQWDGVVAEIQSHVGDGTLSSQMELSTDNGVKFSFSGCPTCSNYTFPKARATAGDVLTDVAGNGVLSWQAVSASGLTIGDPITGGGANRILFESGANLLAESSNFAYNSVTGVFSVAFSGGNHLLIDPTNGLYQFGDITGIASKNAIYINDPAGLITNQFSSQWQVVDSNTAYQYLRLVNGDVNISTFGLGHIIQIGDTFSDANDTMMQFDDFSGQVFVQTNGDFGVQTVGGARAVNVNFAGGTDFIFEAGDANGILNGTKLSVLDSTQKITLTGAEVNTVQYATPVTGATVTVTAKVNRLVIEPAGALAAVTIDLPSSPSNGQYFEYLTTQAITTVTLSGGTVVGAAFSGIGGQELVYVGSQSKWYVMR